MIAKYSGGLGLGIVPLYGGGTLDLNNPDPADINIQDIAHHLANECRFNGGVREFYSVAQHCVHVSDWLAKNNPRLRMLGLLHDAHEYVAKDLPKPLKAIMGKEYNEICKRLDKAIYAALKVEPPNTTEKKVIKAVDDALCRVEAECLMAGGGRTWDWRGIPHREMPIWPLDPKGAKELFMNRWYQLLWQLSI